jgi:hypothetical protein
MNLKGNFPFWNICRRFFKGVMKVYRYQKKDTTST